MFGARVGILQLVVLLLIVAIFVLAWAKIFSKVGHYWDIATSLMRSAILSGMRQLVRFLWNATRGHHLAPWRSPYLRWRMETYSGLKMDKIGFLEFWGFLFRERKQLGRFLKWTAEMENYARPKPKNP